MKLNSECMECLIRRHLQTAQEHGNEDQVTAFARDLMALMVNGPVEASAPYYTPGISRLFSRHFGIAEDRFAEEKRLSNQFVLERLGRIRALVQQAADPLYAGLQMAILGNYIDFSALQGEVSFEKLDEMIENFSQIQVESEAFEALRADLARGKNLVYLTDNAGEIGFDRVFAEEIHRQFPDLSITFCVRGAPAQNDATREDASVMGIPFPVIDNGSAIPGTMLSEASDELLRAMETSDIVIAKGQANAETLMDAGHTYNVYYAFLVKCRRFMDRFGKPKLTPMLVRDFAKNS